MRSRHLPSACTRAASQLRDPVGLVRAPRMWCLALLLAIAAGRIEAQPTQSTARILDVNLVLEGPVQVLDGVNVGLYGPNTMQFAAGDTQRFTLDTLARLLERRVGAAFGFSMLPTAVTDAAGTAVPGPALMPEPGMKGGHPRSYRIQGLPDAPNLAQAMAAQPGADYGVQLSARAYRTPGRGSDKITNKAQQEFYDLDIRLLVRARDGRTVFDKTLDGIRWDGEKYYPKIMGKRRGDTSMTGAELVALVDAALTKLLDRAKLR